MPSPSTARTAFAPGACVSLSPLREAPRGVVFLDAGHGGLDPGASGTTTDGRRIDEKTVTLSIVKETAIRLRTAGYRVVVSRWSDTGIVELGSGDVRSDILTAQGVHRDLLARIACANAARADVLVSIHTNAFSDPKEGGTMTFYDPDRPFFRDSRRFAELLHARVVSDIRRAGLRIQDRSVVPDTVSMGRKALTKEGARYGHEVLLGPYSPTYVPTPSVMPGAILETLFLTRPAEADFVMSSKGANVLAAAITAAVRDFLEG